MFSEWFEPILSWLGLGLIPALLLIIIILLIVKGD